MTYLDVKFNFWEKRYEFGCFPIGILFDSKLRMLPIIGDNEGNEIQFFNIENIPAYVLNFDGRFISENGNYCREVCVYKVIDFDYYEKKLHVGRKLSSLSSSAVKQIFNEFVTSELKRKQSGGKLEFVPKEIPDVEDLVKLYALAHIN